MLPTLVLKTRQEIDSGAVERFISASVITTLDNPFTLNTAINFRNNWCWAVVAEGVSLYHDPPNGHRQCRIAKAVFPQDKCCTKLTDCNRVAELEDAMGAQSTGNLAAPRVTGPISFTLVTTEIDNERPPACRISTRNGHYIAIIATLFNNEDPNNPTEKVTTADPIYGVKEEDYAKLQCIWTDTYHTHKGANKWLSLLPLILRKIFWFFRIQ